MDMTGGEEELTRKISGGQHCGKNSALELSPCIEFLEAVHCLLSVNQGGHSFSLLQTQNQIDFTLKITIFKTFKLLSCIVP